MLKLLTVYGGPDWDYESHKCRNIVIFTQHPFRAKSRQLPRSSTRTPTPLATTVVVPGIITPRWYPHRLSAEDFSLREKIDLLVVTALGPISAALLVFSCDEKIARLGACGDVHGAGGGREKSPAA